VTISAIHRVSLATHDLAEAQKFFESYIGLGRAVKVADQTIAFGSGSRGLRIRKPPRLLNRTTSELHGSAGTRHVAFDTDDLNGIASRLDRAAIPYVHALPGDFETSAIYTIDPAMNVVAFCQRSTGGPTDQPAQFGARLGLGNPSRQSRGLRRARSSRILCRNRRYDRRPLASSGCCW